MTCSQHLFVDALQHSASSQSGTSSLAGSTLSLPKTPSTQQEKLNDRWVWEVLSSVIAVPCLVAIVTILALYQGKPLPQLPGLVSINSSVVIFTS